MLVVHLQLLGLHGLTLRPLVLRILANKAQTAVHLIEVFGREDKHQPILHRPVTRHITHRLDIVVLPLLQLHFKRVKLRVEDADIAVDMTDVFLNTIDVLLIFIDLTVDCHQVVQAFGHISLVLLERLFLLSDLTLNVSALVSQLLYRGIGDIIAVSRHTFS